MAKKFVRVSHLPTGTRLAEGPLGWGITPFEGNLYTRAKHLRTGFQGELPPGLCFYKFLYVWLNLRVDDETFRNLTGAAAPSSAGQARPCRPG